jgi:hypothetical protein
VRPPRLKLLGAQRRGDSLAKQLERFLAGRGGVPFCLDQSLVDERFARSELVPCQIKLDSSGRHVPVVQALHPTVVLDIGNHEIATEQILDDKGAVVPH